jgi:hypothetical protein
MSLLVAINYAAADFFLVNANVTLNKDDLAKIIPTEDYPNADLDSALQEEITFDLELKIPASLVWKTNTAMLKQLVQQGNLNPDLTETTNALIDEQVNSIVDNLMPVIENVALKIAKSVAVEQAKQSIINALKDQSSADDIAERLEVIDIDKHFEDLTKDLSSGEKTVAEVTDKVIDTMDNIIEELKTNDDEILSTIESIDETVLRDKISEGLSAFADENGIINIEEAIAGLLLNGLDSFSNSEENNESSSVTPTAIALSTETQNKEESNVEKLKADVKAKLLELLPDGFNEILATFLKVSAFTLVLSMFTWIYLMLKILCKIFYPNNSVKLKLPLLLGHLPGLVLWLLPTVVFQIIKNSLEMGSVALYFASSGALAVLVAFVLMIIAIPYCSLRRPLKPRKLR